MMHTNGYVVSRIVTCLSPVIPIRSAIPVIMGTNVGTSVTSTLVSLAQVGDRTEFRRAFAGATVHDMFNWSAVLVLLPLEIAFSYLYYLTKAIVTTMNLHSKNVKFEFLSALTRPFTRLIVEINEEVITDIAMAPNITEESLVMKRWCQVTVVQRTVSVMRYAPVLVNCRDVHRDSPFYSSCTGIGSADDSGISNIVGLYRGWNDTEVINTTVQRSRCTSLFALTDMGDKAAGVLTLILSIIVILSSLFGIVKILNSMLKGSVAKVINKTMNTDFPGKFAYLTGYLAFFVGMGMTIVIQSSSVGQWSQNDKLILELLNLYFVGWVYLVAVGGPIFFIFIVATVVNVLQVKRPNWLPRGLRSWEFLPKFLHSCAPYDVLISCRIITDRCPKFEDKMELSKTLT
uniref:Sodium-dependent phosphate transport protein 2B n=1 Tax=Biomphalaria glabrata TaxID=6526 RepID=A0A2C9L1J5_BIOGL